MNTFSGISALVFTACMLPALAGSPSDRVLLHDDFEREESTPDREEVGNGWGTNSRWRAKGQKQVDLKDGAIHVTRAEIADHGVSVFHDVEFRNATIELRFRIGREDDVGVNLADLQEKSVHAGHICAVRVRPKSVELADLKTGRMRLDIRNQRKAGKLSPELQKLVNSRAKTFDVDLAVNEWHHLTVHIVDDLMSVMIDGEKVGEFRSEGIAHPTKRKLRLAVNRSAWIDDVRITEPGS